MYSAGVCVTVFVLLSLQLSLLLATLNNVDFFSIALGCLDIFLSVQTYIWIYLSIFSLNVIDSYAYKLFSNNFLYMLFKKKTKHICCNVGKIKGTSLGLQIQLCPVHILETAAVINFCCLCYPSPPLFLLAFMDVRCYKEDICMTLQCCFCLLSLI